jgi:excisionase family DNA binding protein
MQSKRPGTRPLTIQEAAEYAGVSDSRVRDAMNTGGLMWKRRGRERATTRQWVEEWLNG